MIPSPTLRPKELVVRSPVYRNLDEPVRILGFNAFELIILCVTLVAGGELLEVLGIHRVWSFWLVMVLGLALFWLRHSFGDHFLHRFVRFLRLPKHLAPKIFNRRDIP